MEADLLRSFHPGYEDLKRIDPMMAIAATASDSGKWTEKLVTALAERKAHVVVEGTMRRIEPFRDTAALLRGRGYDIQAALIAVDERISWQATIQRAEEMAALGDGMRVVERNLHDAAVIGMLETMVLRHMGLMAG